MKKNKKIIVFGATGTLGAYISLHLKSIGYDVISVGKRICDNGFFKEYDIPYYSVDISSDIDFSILPEGNIYAVLNFAGALPATMSGYTPTSYIDSIVKGTLNVLEYSRKINAKKIIFPQSLFDISYLFGSPNPIPANAERRVPICGDHTVYVIAKNAALDLIEYYYREYGINRYILRLPRIYLYHPNPYTFIDGEKKIISDRLLIYKAIKGEDIELWGNPDNLLETVCIYDFLQIIEKCILSEKSGGIYNVGSGGSTLKERIDGIIDVFCENRRSNIIYKPENCSGTSFVLDISETVSDLGYTPKYTWKMYLKEFKKEMELQRFEKIWGKELML